MSPYRTSEAIVVVDPPRGLVRANGSACYCRPPGLLMRWWHGVEENDRWFCRHGGEWLCIRDLSNLFFELHWLAVPQSGGDT